MNSQYIHHIPGRLRVRIPALKANAKAAQELQVSLQQLQGVTSVEINLLTGSVLVHYDGRSATAGLVFGLLHRKAPLRVASETSTGQIGEKVVKFAASYLLEAAIERVVVATLVGLL